MSGDWRFARRPFWVFSHVFAISVVALFVALGFWQLDRLDVRQERNELIESRTAETIVLAGRPEGGPDGAELDYQAVEATVRFVDADFVRVGNRSQGGAAGEHVVAIVELDDGSELAVNRGFVPSNAAVELQPVPDGPVRVQGWLRATVERGFIGATDDGRGTVLPRLDTERVAARLGRPLPTVWLQLAPAPDDAAGEAGSPAGLTSFPDPVPLPPLDEGPHRGYAVQWFIFATLGSAFYAALLWRQSTGDRAVVAAPTIESLPAGDR